MQDFLKFFDEQRRSYPMHLDIYYSKITDWIIRIWRKGCGANGEDLVICEEQSHDMEMCFAKAQVALKNWLIDNEGGY